MARAWSQYPHAVPVVAEAFLNSAALVRSAASYEPARGVRSLYNRNPSVRSTHRGCGVDHSRRCALTQCVLGEFKSVHVCPDCRVVGARPCLKAPRLVTFREGYANLRETSNSLSA